MAIVVDAVSIGINGRKKCVENLCAVSERIFYFFLSKDDFVKDIGVFT
jgi:hypothetical protein